MAAFKFVDETEQRVVNFLKRRYKDFQLENQNNEKIIEATDKGKKALDWSEQFENENSLGIRFQDDRTNLVKMKEKDPFSIDDVNDQLKRIQKLEALSIYHPQFYETWKQQTLPAGVDSTLLPIVAAFFNGDKTAIEKQCIDKKKPGIYKKEAITDIAITRDKDLKWENIKITFLSDVEFHIQYKSDSITRSFKHAGFENKKNSLPIQSWQILKKAAEKNSAIPYDFKTRNKVEKIAQNLRSKFRTLFPGIDSKTDPVPIDSKNKVYRFTFHLDCSE